jgi:hypothetical protein
VTAIALTAVIVATVTPVRANPDAQLTAAKTEPADFALRRGESRTDQRVLVVGDSVAHGLALHYRNGDLGHPIVLRSAARLGCALGPSRDPECATVPEKWKVAVDGFDPDVSIIVPGSWDLLPQLLTEKDETGKPMQTRTPAFERYLMKRLAAGFASLTSRGGAVAVFTVPCYVFVVRSRSPKLEDIAWFNGVLRAAAAKAGPSVKVVDYGQYICPNGVNRPEIDGVQMRYDGVHLTHEGAQMVWRWLAPQLPTRAR